MTADATPDREERHRALDPSRSFIVRAPAGSGKTELLIQRYLALLATVAAPEEIVAITFTRKAAGEMRHRVLAALAAASDAPGAAGAHRARTLELARAARARDAERGWQLARNPTRLRVQTIDALCAALTRQMPVLSRFGAAPRIVERAEHLYREAARAAIAQVESQQDVARSVERLLVHLDNDAARLEALLADMLARRDHWIRHAGKLDRRSLEAALASVREDGLARTRDLLTPGQRGELAAIAAYAFGNLGRPAFADDVESWTALRDVLLTQKGTWRQRPGQREGFPSGRAGDAWRARAAALALGDEFRETLADLRRLPPARYRDAQWEVIDAIARLLQHALAQLDVVLALHGEIDFPALTQGAVRALGEDDAPTELALALDYRIRHLLVDEFQDTSISQYQLVARLTAGWEPGDGRTLFAVGDPMQSIYRFREAEVGEFLRTWEATQIGGVPLERVSLSANFRSHAGITRWVNDAFARIMPAREDVTAGAVPYARSADVRDALPGPAVAVHPFFDGDRDGEAATVVDLVTAARADAGSVAILVRNRGHLAEIVPRLRARGLRFRAIEIEALGERPVVQDLLALTRALAHPADRVAWLALLRAPWCGLTLADLAALAEGRTAETVWELMQGARLAGLTPDGAARVARVRNVLAGALAARLRGTLRDRVEAAWLRLGGPACVADATDLEDADVYLDALEAAEDAGAVLDLAAFEQRLAELWALPDVHADDRDVQIMTIHKAKGLEFDHVIVPGLGGRARDDEKRLFLWTERPARAPGAEAELLVAPIEESGAETDATYAWLRRLDVERDRHEAARLLYVAVTRARRRVHLLGDVRRDDRSGAPKEPPANCLLAPLWPIVAAHFGEPAAALAAGSPARPAPADARPLARGNLRRLASGWVLAEAPPAATWRAPEDAVRSQDEIEFSWVGETARHVGTVVHRWLQRIADDALAGWDDARVAGARAAVRRELAARGVREAELDAAADRVLSGLARAIAGERGRWILGPHAHAVSEHRLTAVVDGAVRRLIVDRLFRDATGAHWIVDYKTSSHEGADPEGFLDRERERYAAQLGRYARALGSGPRLGLYFPLLQGWREVP